MSAIGMIVASAIGTVFVLGIVCTIAVFIHFDRLLRIQYSKHKQEWEREGCAIGFFWVPPGAKAWSGGWVRSEVISAWSSSRPGWVDADEEARHAYARFKRLSKFANTASFIWLAIFALIWLALVVVMSG